LTTTASRNEFPPLRRERIVRRVLAHGWMATEDIAREIGVSPATVRRDLALLTHQHRLVRIHGGAAAPAATAPTDVTHELQAGVAVLRAANLPGAEAFLRAELDRQRGAPD
jgi:transposase-like protein